MTESIVGGAKTLEYTRKVICPSCDGKRGKIEKTCRGCKGTGIKKDPLFKKESKCISCSGYGDIISKNCTPCKGLGLIEQLT
mgnify:CR=1 FL=1